MDDRKIPLIVGVAGHIAVRAEDVDALTGAVTSELVRLARAYPDSELVMLTRLAPGADLLCADAAAALGVPVIAALPMEADACRRAFSEADAARFDAHLARARRVMVAPSAEVPPAHPGLYDQYRQAGIYVATHSHVLLALWDGSAPGENSCGASAAVDIALHGTYRPAKGNLVHRVRNTLVVHIYTPRGGNAARRAGEIRYLGDEKAIRGILARTDEFNRSANSVAMDNPLLPEAALDDPLLKHLNGAYAAADGLSCAAAAVYQRVLALLASASTLLTLAFLLYDEIDAIWMILVCGAMLVMAVLCRRWAVRSDCHRRYVEYRALAEWIRVQAYLRYAGSPLQVTELLTWTQLRNTAWIASAMRALCIGPAPESACDIRQCWVDDQRAYHEKARGRTALSLRKSERVVSAALVMSAALYVMAVLFEMLFGGLAVRPLASPGSPEICRTFLKVALGTVSAATVFIANYYGKQSLPRKLSDHDMLSDFYSEMLNELTLYGQEAALLEQLAREELTENGNWVSYQLDNTPDISL